MQRAAGQPSHTHTHTQLAQWGCIARCRYQLSTKVGRTLLPIHEDTRNVVVAERSGWQGSQAFDVEFDFSGGAVVEQHQQSLQRLGVGRVDCLVIHDLEQSAGGGAGYGDTDVVVGAGKTVAEHTETLFGEGGGFRALQELRAAGKIKAFGAAVNCPASPDVFLQSTLDTPSLFLGRGPVRICHTRF